MASQISDSPTLPNIRFTGGEVLSALGKNKASFEAGLLSGNCGLTEHLQGWPVGYIPNNDLKSSATDRKELLINALLAGLNNCSLPRTLLKDPDTILILSSTKGEISGLIDPASNEVNLGQLLPKIRHRIHHQGHGELISSACASGGAAIARAARLIQAGWGTRAIVIGVDFLNNFLIQGFASIKALSTDPCRPYDEGRTGLSLGEAIGVIFLEKSDKPGIYLTGFGLSCDAHSLIRPPEDGSGLVLAIRRALGYTKPGPIDRKEVPVDAICGHGTGTIANDAMELAGIRNCFTEAPPLFGIKGATGHTLGSCGVLDSIATELALNRNTLIPTTGFDSGDFIVTRTLRNQPLNRIISVNSGFGGINSALVFEKRG